VRSRSSSAAQVPGSRIPSLIEDLEVRGSTIRVRADRAFTERFLREDFVVEYERDIDLRTLASSTLLLPFVLNVAPILWAAGWEARVEEMDEELASVLGPIRETYRRLYPRVRWDGQLHAATVRRGPDAPPVAGAAGTAVLFSGGVDSTATSLLLDEPQLLITIWGNEIALDNQEGWGSARGYTEAYARRHGHRPGFIRSNFRSFLDVSRLNGAFPGITNWWLDVQHGIGLVGLAAPLMAARGANRILFSSGRTEEQITALGAGPDLEGRLRWSGRRAEHALGETRRHDKLRSVVERVRSGEAREITLRVCFMYPYGGGGNCGACEKCLRTMAGLLVEGEDPRAYGFPGSPRKVSEAIRRRFRTLRMRFGEAPGHYWEELAQRAAERLGIEGADLRAAGEPIGGFLRWVSTYDFAAYARRWARVGAARAWAIATIRRSPRATRIAMRLMARARRRRLRSPGAPGEGTG